MNAARYMVTITGQTPLLMHHDNLSWAEKMKAWSKDPANQKISVAGDDRTPAHRWIGNLYVEGGLVVMPSDNLMTVLREGGARCPTGKKGGTYKRQTQSGIVVDQSSWPIETQAGKVEWANIEPLIQCDDFALHEESVKKLGFELFVKRAKIGQAKHVRVRPRFDRWSCSGTLTVFDETITFDVLKNILTFAIACGGYRGQAHQV